uniref:Basigin n=1 Tax=Falco tinnunculus TaxID=100819 RepID=A0A8C4U6I2_FALTI
MPGTPGSTQCRSPTPSRCCCGPRDPRGRRSPNRSRCRCGTRVPRCCRHSVRPGTGPARSRGRCSRVAPAAPPHWLRAWLVGVAAAGPARTGSPRRGAEGGEMHYASAPFDWPRRAGWAGQRAGAPRDWPLGGPRGRAPPRARPRLRDTARRLYRGGAARRGARVEMAAGAAGPCSLLALLLLGGLAVGVAGTSPEIKAHVTGVSGKLILSCNITAPYPAIKGHEWMHGDKILQTDTESSAFTSYTIEGKMEEHSGVYDCVYKTNPVIKAQVNISVPPQVMAYKKSEHGNEGDTGVLTCKNPSFPPVFSWFWYKSGQEPIINGSGRYIIKSSGNKTELRILKLNIEEDTGDYHCNATNSYGSGGATVNLRVRSRLAALWPFLGIVAEVLVLVTIIFIYEKRRKPDEVLDGKATPQTTRTRTSAREMLTKRGAR